MKRVMKMWLLKYPLQLTSKSGCSLFTASTSIGWMSQWHCVNRENITTKTLKMSKYFISMDTFHSLLVLDFISEKKGMIHFEILWLVHSTSHWLIWNYSLVMNRRKLELLSCWHIHTSVDTILIHTEENIYISILRRIFLSNWQKIHAYVVLCLIVLFLYCQNFAMI